jgi:LPXTG-motif cell wall-anchored protein
MSVRTNVILGTIFILVGVALAAFGFYVGETDDAPGAALLGLLLMSGAVFLGVKRIRRPA